MAAFSGHPHTLHGNQLDILNHQQIAGFRERKDVMSSAGQVCVRNLLSTNP